MNLEDVGSICKSKRQAGTQNPFWVHKDWHGRVFGFRDLCRVPSVLGLASQGVCPGLQEKISTFLLVYMSSQEQFSSFYLGNLQTPYCAELQIT